MKNFIYILLLPLLLLLVGCNPVAEYNLDGVQIEIEVPRYSAGYAQVKFTTNKVAYYLVGVENYTNKHITAYPEQYMTLAVDSVYIDYMEWRHKYLKEGETNIADFQSHSLRYGDAVQTFYPLEPDKDYWVYAFVVDPDTKQPHGELFKRQIHTRAAGDVDLHCDFRVDGDWLYTYPKDKNGNIIDYCPYFWCNIDNKTFQNVYGGSVDALLKALLPSMDDYALWATYGVDVWHSQDDELETGETYDVISCCVDGAISNKVHYQYTYEGLESKIERKFPQDTVKVSE